MKKTALCGTGKGVNIDSTEEESITALVLYLPRKQSSYKSQVLLNNRQLQIFFLQAFTTRRVREQPSFTTCTTRPPAVLK